MDARGWEMALEEWEARLAALRETVAQAESERDEAQRERDEEKAVLRECDVVIRAITGDAINSVETAALWVGRIDALLVRLAAALKEGA
jgi:hypothetical protein